MKKIFQLFLIIILISSLVIFYYKFFDNESVKEEVNIEITSPNKTVNETTNNVIKNLNYQIKIENDNDYKISSEFSEISYKSGVEYVLMKKVKASLKDKDNRTILISSNNASYNNDNHNTIFENKVKISYLDNVIFAEKMILDFEKNYILISDNVNYNGSMGILKADNIKINLITKKISISMNNNNENIIISSTK